MGYDGLLFCFWVQSGTGMSYMSIFSFFLPYLQDHGLFSSRNFASKAKRRKQLFLSTSSKTTQMSTSAWGMPFLQYLPLPFSTKTTPTTHNSTQSLIIPLHQWCSCAHDHKYPQYRGTAVRIQIMPCWNLLLAKVQSSSIICYFLLELTRFKFWFWKVIKIWSVINGFDMNWNGSRSFPKNEEKDSVGMICL